MKPQKTADKIAGLVLLGLIIGFVVFFVPLKWSGWLISFGYLIGIILGLYVVIIFLSNFSTITHQSFIVGKITKSPPVKMYDLHYENSVFTTKGPVFKQKFNLSDLVEIRLNMDVDMGLEEHYFLDFTFKNKRKLFFNGANKFHIGLVNQILTTELNREPIEYYEQIATPFFKSDEGKEYKIIYTKN